MLTTPRLLGIVLLLVACTGIGMNAYAANGQQKQKAKPQEVQIVVDAYIPENGTEPMEKLLQALEKHPEKNLFRVTWKFSGYLHGTGSALYHRKEQTVKYWYHAFTAEYSDVEHCIVSGVNVAMLKRVVQDPQNGHGSATDGAFFDRLYQYGGKRTGLKHTHR